MARRVSNYRIRRIADRGNEEDGPDSRARGDRFYRNRRSADRGNEKVDRDPRNIFEIKGLRRRVRDLKIQREIIQIRKRIRELELQRDMRKETESSYVVRDDVNEEEEYPSFDSYPRFFEPIYPDFFSEDEPKFDEDEVDIDEGERLFLEQALRWIPEGVPMARNGGSIFTLDDIERNEGEKGLVDLVDGSIRVGVGEYEPQADKSDGSRLFDLPVQNVLDLESVNHEYIGEPSNTKNFDIDYLLDEPYFDATTGDLSLDESLFFEVDDLKNAVETDPGLDMLNEYISFSNSDINNSQYTFDSKGSKNILPDSSLALENVNDGTHQVSETSQPFEGQNNDIASSSKKGHPDEGRDMAYPFLQKASYMLGNIAAPPALASEFPTKYLASASQASGSAHLTSGMIHISDVSFSGGAMDLSLGKHAQFNIVLSFGLGQRGVNYPPEAVKPNSGVSRSWFYCSFIWILVLSLSFKIGSLICPRSFMN